MLLPARAARRRPAGRVPPAAVTLLLPPSLRRSKYGRVWYNHKHELKS